MAGGFLRGAALAAAGVVLGLAGGWVAGRASVPPPPPPEPLRNPLADAKKGETLLLRRADGQTTLYRVLAAEEDSILLSEETTPPGGAATRREVRVARTYLGFFIILEGDVDPAEADAAARDFTLDEAVPETLFSEALGRSFRCWRIRGRHRVRGELTFWITPELPVHGLLRADAPRGTTWEAVGRGE